MPNYALRKASRGKFCVIGIHSDLSEDYIGECGTLELAHKLAHKEREARHHTKEITFHVFDERGHECKESLERNFFSSFFEWLTSISE